MLILTEFWFIRDCFFIALTLGLVFTCLSNTEAAIEEPVTYFIAITPVYFFTFWIGACMLLTYATVTRSQVQGWGFFFFILCIISGALVIDPKDPASPCIWEREFQRQRFSTEGFFAKANAWVREHRPLIFRPPPTSECLDVILPETTNRQPWWYTKQEADQMVDDWLRKFGLQNGTYRSHILWLLERSNQVLQGLAEDWKREPDPAKRGKILRRRREELIKLQEEAVCGWQPDYCDWAEQHGYMPQVEENEENKEKRDTEPTTSPTWQPTREADGAGPEQEHTGALHTHVPNTEGERHRDAQDILGGLGAETEIGSLERDDEQGAVERERGEPASESTAETIARVQVKAP
ncbi:hypothetical protein EV426DRAFT_668019 [Tirmania nivea]|nr:hypothetical protein EV426DRAFT_668019 [Tirmania nivea]